MILYQILITVLLLFFLSCSSDKNKNYAQKMQSLRPELQSPQAKKPEPTLPQEQEIIQKCSIDFFDSEKEIRKLSASNQFKFEVEDSYKKTRTETAHGFLIESRTLDKCRKHVETYSQTPFKCVDINGKTHEMTESFDICKSSELKNTKDKLFNTKRKLLKRANRDFIEHFFLKKRMLEKYSLRGSLIKKMNRLKIEVIHEDIESLINPVTKKSSFNVLKFMSIAPYDQVFSRSKRNSKTIVLVDGEILKTGEKLSTDNTPQKYFYRSKESGVEISSDALLIGCHIPFISKTSSFQWINHFESFKTNEILLKEERSGLKSVYDESASTVKILPPRSTNKNHFKRSFAVECKSQVPELLTIENINKVLEGIIRIEAID